MSAQTKGTRVHLPLTGGAPRIRGPREREPLTPRRALLGALRLVIPLAYVVGFYACTFYLPTMVAAVVMGVIVLVSCAWFFVCMRVEDDRRAQHLALQGFIIKVLTLPLEILVIMVYVTLMALSSYEVESGLWFILIALLYLGILGGSVHVIGAAREARDAGLLPRGWARAFTICAAVPVADLVAGIFLWFALLKRRLFDEDEG